MKQNYIKKIIFLGAIAAIFIANFANAQTFSSTEKTAPAPALNDEASKAAATEIKTIIGEQAIEGAKKIPPEEIQKRYVAAIQALNSPEVTNFLDNLKIRKTSLINKLKQSNCIDNKFSESTEQFVDKLVNKKFDQQQLAAGAASLFSQAEISKLLSNLDEMPNELQAKVGMLVTQFVINESPELFVQFLKISQKKNAYKAQKKALNLNNLS